MTDGTTPTRSAAGIVTWRPCRPEQTALAWALLDLVDRGGRVRCSDPATHQLWTSDDYRDRKLAVRWCAGCPVLTAAGQTETAGVWGGVDRTRRHRGDAEEAA